MQNTGRELRVSNQNHYITGEIADSVSRERLHIAVGVILDLSANKILVSRRPSQVHLGGLWEFPGGKINPDESVQDALSRELHEELNITVNKARPLIQINHDYTDESVNLDVWLVTEWNGEPEGREGQQVEWVRKDALSKLDFPQANRPIITAIDLPSVYWITPDLLEYGDEFFKNLKINLEAGLQLIQFRSKRLEIPDIHKTLKKMYELCSRYDCRLLINGIPEEKILNYVHGVHLPSNDLLYLKNRPLVEKYLIAASCHNRIELEHACRIGVDFTVLSPVKKTKSHKNTPPMGWDTFTKMAKEASIPVYALGGMQQSDITHAQFCGAQGVAMISGLWGMGLHHALRR